MEHNVFAANISFYIVKFFKLIDFEERQKVGHSSYSIIVRGKRQKKIHLPSGLCPRAQVGFLLHGVIPTTVH